MLESFVFSELTKAVPFSRMQPHILHYRDKDKVEVDFVLEDARRNMVGIEVKVSATVAGADFAGLRRLEGHVGQRFRLGVVLYGGSRVLPFGPRLFAAPLSVLWGA